MDERVVADSVQQGLAFLAEKVALGQIGTFPLFGSSTRAEIAKSVDELRNAGVLSPERGLYVAINMGDLNAPLRVDLVDSGLNKVYFVARSDAENFRSLLASRYPQKEFGCGLSTLSPFQVNFNY